MSVTEHRWADLARVAGRSDEQLRHWQREDQRPGHATDAEKIVLLTDAYRGAVDTIRDLIGNARCMCDHPLRQGYAEPCSKCRAQAFLSTFGGQ